MSCCLRVTLYSRGYIPWNTSLPLTQSWLIYLPIWCFVATQKLHSTYWLKWQRRCHTVGQGYSGWLNGVWDTREHTPPTHLCAADSFLHLDMNPPMVHPAVYDDIDADLIWVAALHTFGAGGPSGTDATCWQRLCTSFKMPSNELCHAIFLVAKKLCTSFADPISLSPLLACRLATLRKNPRHMSYKNMWDS